MKWNSGTYPFIAMKIKGVPIFRITWIIVLSLNLGCDPDRDIHPLVYEVPERIEPYIERFKQEAELRGKTINLDYLKVEFVDEVIFQDTTNVIGLCIRKSKGTHTIQLDTGSLWWYLGDLAIEEVIFHELGHCFLNRPHVDDVLISGEFSSIMRTKGAVLYTHNPDFKYKNSYKRDYYLDELFYESVEEPCWSTKLPNSNINVQSFTRRDFNGSANFIPENVITDRNGNTWLYGFDQLFKYNGNDDFEHFELPIVEGSDNPTWIYRAYNDISGDIWFLMNVLNEGKRLYKLQENGSFELKLNDAELNLPNDFYELYITDESQIFINSYSSFGIINLNTNSIQTFTNEDLGLKNEDYFPVSIDGHQNGKIYFSKGDQFFLYEKETGIKKVTNENSHLLDGRINQLIVNDFGDVWLLVNREIVHYEEASGSFIKLDRVSSNLLNSYIFQITYDQENNLWAATNHGLKKYDNNLERFSGFCDYYFEADPEKLNRLGFDIDNNAWVRENRSVHRIEMANN